MKSIDPAIRPEKVSVRPFDDLVENLYAKEQKTASVITLFSLVAIIISLVGVFGLVVFETQHRRREIALRRVHGSTAGEVIAMFTTKFLKIVGVSSLIALPAAYYISSNWMNDFAFRIPLYWWVFVGALVVVGGLTVATVVTQSWRSANANPIESLKQN